MMASPAAAAADTAPVKRLTLLVVDSQLPVVEPGSCYNKDINTKLGTYYALYTMDVMYLIQSIKICRLDIIKNKHNSI